MAWPFIDLCPCSEKEKNCSTDVYCGPVLANLGIDPKDSLIVCLQKINEAFGVLLEYQSINTAFGIVEPESNLSKIHDSNNPNFEIHLTGDDVELTIIETVNGDAGIINLYFSGAETVTLNGLPNPLIIIGSGQMVSVFFIVDTQGLYWFIQTT